MSNVLLNTLILNMENVIVSLIIAVAVIVNIIRNYQKEVSKNKKRTQSPQTRPSHTPDVQDFRREIEEIVNQEKTYTQSSYDSPPVYSNNTNLESKTSYNRIFEEEGVSAFENKHNKYNTMNESDLTTEKNTQTDLQLSTSDDLKRAFIHSLIFERKY